MGQYASTLNQEIQAYYDRNKITQQEINVKLELAKNIDRLLDHRFQLDVEVVAMGSSKTQLGLKNCDLDLCCLVKPIQTYRNSPRLITQMLPRIKSVLNEEFEDQCDSVEILQSKNVSLIRLNNVWFKDVLCNVDISFNNLLGLRNTHLLCHYAQLDERFAQLVLLVKQWADKADIADPRNGTFSGFCLTLLVVHFLQQRDPPVLPILQQEMPNVFNSNIPVERLDYRRNLSRSICRSSNEQTVGELLLGFFDYYANRIDFTKQALSISSKEIKTRLEHKAYIHVEEPYDPLKNVGARIFERHRFAGIEDAFRQAYMKLKTEPKLRSLNLGT